MILDTIIYFMQTDRPSPDRVSPFSPGQELIRGSAEVARQPLFHLPLLMVQWTTGRIILTGMGLILKGRMNVLEKRLLDLKIRTACHWNWYLTPPSMRFRDGMKVSFPKSLASGGSGVPP